MQPRGASLRKSQSKQFEPILQPVWALALTGLFSSELFGVTATDPATFIGESVLLTTAALAEVLYPGALCVAGGSDRAVEQPLSGKLRRPRIFPWPCRLC
jgi:hypothetical protein